MGYAKTVVDFLVLLNAGDILEYLRDCHLFRKDTGSWTWFVRVSVHSSFVAKFNWSVVGPCDGARVSTATGHFEVENTVHILESNPHPNLIRTSFCRFLKRKKKLVRGCNPHLSFNRPLHTRQTNLTLILRRSRTGTVWFYTSTSNKRAAWPKLYTKSLTRDLKRMYNRFTLVRISINL